MDCGNDVVLRRRAGEPNRLGGSDDGGSIWEDPEVVLGASVSPDRNVPATRVAPEIDDSYGEGRCFLGDDLDSMLAW